MSEKSHAHFKGKDALSHVIEARLKGKKAFSEIHGTNVSASLFYLTEAVKDTSILVMVFWIIASAFLTTQAFIALAILLASWLILKTAQVAYTGWARLERLHKLIEEERWEIQHHREQEREELTVLYEAKGFSGKLLEDVIDVLMSDDNRLLQIMLEEELGLTLKAFEHPLKQAFGAFLGVAIAGGLLALGLYVWPVYGLYATSSVLIIGAAWLVAYKEGRQKFSAVLYSGGIAALCSLTAYFLKDLFIN